MLHDMPCASIQDYQQAGGEGGQRDAASITAGHISFACSCPVDSPFGEHRRLSETWMSASDIVSRRHGLTGWHLERLDEQRRRPCRREHRVRSPAAGEQAGKRPTSSRHEQQRSQRINSVVTGPPRSPVLVRPGGNTSNIDGDNNLEQLSRQLLRRSPDAMDKDPEPARTAFLPEFHHDVVLARMYSSRPDATQRHRASRSVLLHFIS